MDSPTWLALAQAIMAAWQLSEQGQRPTVCMALKPAAGGAGVEDVADGHAQQAQHGAPGADLDSPGAAREAQRPSPDGEVSTCRLFVLLDM